MPNVQTITVTKTATLRVTHPHIFDGPGGTCRCGKTEAECDGPVQVTEVTSNSGPVQAEVATGE